SKITPMEVAVAVRITDPVERMDRAAAEMTAASADFLEAIWDCDERGLWRRHGATSMSAWLASRYGLTKRTAREWLRVARGVKELPRIFAAYRSGRLSWDQLRPLVRFVTPQTEPLWVRRGPRLRPATLWREAERHRRVVVRDEAEARRRRFVATWWDREERMLCLSGMLPPEEGAAVEAALAKRAEEVVLTDQPDSPGEARMADALVELVTGGREAEPTPATLVLHADAEAVAGRERAAGPWLAETEGGRRLSTEAVRRLACDARIEWVLERDGKAVGIGRRGRAVPGPLARALRHRDMTCRYPGCSRRRWLYAHHIVHWANGGGTDLDNLVLLCFAHHRLIHEGGWRISGHPDRDLRFHGARGRPVHARAP
ncbi:MAG: HNH endonuclease, partial [Actinomycetota bacterium]|nr:HNH endonuclease [Actinomycetota bacterium]